MRFIVLCILFSSVFAPMAWAAAPMDVCERGENTADHIACMKKRYDEAQAALNKIYDRSVRGYEADESTVDLQRAQQDWLAYRDQECARQVEAEETQSLKRVKGLSCSAALTMQRVDILESQLKDHEKDDVDNVRAYDPVPAWMNVLAEDYPAVFWRYGSRLHADLNCDERDEAIVSGVEFRRGEAGAQIFAVLAISDNPLTGRPASQIFSFPIVMDSAEADGAVCSEAVSMSVVPVPSVKNGQEQPHCQVSLQLEDKACSAFTTIMSRDGHFVVIDERPVEPL